MSRFLAALAVVLSLFAATAAAITAQETPAATGGQLSELGYPEVVITATESGFEVPDEVAAGTVLLTLDNTAPFPNGFSLIQLPEGVTLESLMPPADASPSAEEGAEQGLPPALYDAIWAGGIFAGPGSTAQAVVTLTPGEWLVLTQELSGMPPVLNVTGEAGEAPAAPEGAVNIELADYQVVLPEVMPAGPQFWNVTNTGTEPHEVFIMKTPERLTLEQAQALATMAPDAEPDPNLPNVEEFIEVGGVAPISNGQSTMLEMNLEPGHYIAVCFIPAMDSGEPHAAKGMVTIFSVGADGEEVEAPASPESDGHASH